ncbi:UNVERIFIED_ORG: hypothetical protein B2H98_06440 [Clostridium botulinum]|uniref:DUF5104 domain-containing protein n=1 Tax=Clostridium botulinum TaxID=1491 RepID=A0A6M0ST98_CLOBO|nr:DUF5104 domain-containing protein [Clostridium botulinum]
MNIKKITLIITAVIFSFNLISCDSLKDKMINKRLNKLNESSKIRDKRSKEVFEVLKNKDKEGLKKLFSISALKEAENIDESIDYVMNLLDGEITSIDGGEGPSSESSGGGAYIAEDTYEYTIITDKGAYLLFLIYISADTFNRENEGLYMFQLIKEEDKQTEYDGGNVIVCPGVYVPPSSKYTDIKFQDGAEIAGGFKFLKYAEDYSDGKFNIYATIQSDIAYGDVEVSFCFYDVSGKKIGSASQRSEDPVEAGGIFEVKLTASDYHNKDLNYEDIASCRFSGIYAR